MATMVPDDPEAYFLEFFPEQFRQNRAHFPKGDTAASTRYRMRDVGSWCFRVTNDELVAEAGEGNDVALEIESSREDFEALFVRHAREEVRRTGELSEGSKAALRPLVLTAKKKSICDSTTRSLELSLTFERTPRSVLVTPGGGTATKPGATVRMKFEDYLAIQTGKRSTTTLFMTGKLKVKGDLSHALKLNPLLG